MVIYPARVTAFLSIHALAWCSWRCHGWWGRRAWGRLGMINFLPWRCHGCWSRQAWGRTRWQARNHDRYEVFRLALYPNTVFLWDAIFDRWSTRMSIRVHSKAFLAIKLLAYPRRLSLSRIYPILWHKLWPLHASALHRRRASRCRLNFQFILIQNLFADHVHRRSGVDNKFSFHRFKGWWRKQAPIFRRWEECCFMFLVQFWDAFSQPPRCFTGTSLLPFRLFLRPILKFWSIGVTLMRITWANHSKQSIFLSRMLAWRNTALVHWIHRIGFSIFELFREIVVDFGGSIPWHTQPNCRVILNIATALLSPFFLNILLGCSSTWRCA